MGPVVVRVGASTIGTVVRGKELGLDKPQVAGAGAGMAVTPGTLPELSNRERMAEEDRQMRTAGAQQELRRTRGSMCHRLSRHVWMLVMIIACKTLVRYA